MEDSITPARIANSILQDSNFTGVNILVEGEKDIKLYRKLSCEDSSRIKVTFGKKKMRETYGILSNRGGARVIGIRDADFIRLKGNQKFDPNYDANIFLTDNHDSESMIIKSQAFDDFLLEISKEDRVSAFYKKHGCLREFLYELSYPLACLRFANKKFDLGLAFKPANPDGNKLKFKKIICDKKLEYLGHDKLINTVVEYSKNRGSNIKDREIILKSLLDVLDLKLPVCELVNGHDLAEILFIICKKGLGSSNDDLKGASSVESMLRLSYGREYFSSTELFKKLYVWQKSQNLNIFSPVGRVA
ncbi:DUF4435 domain-containing protein [Halomonas sp. G11]|uniref:DUF4435 domain-containing protein n=1 Tax=Halomonas sp. G11 TaxID=1684425 RepID=UPI0007FBB436|nr:DUF4435 domain-containing protein [Halomonas sp. G11]OAZ98391.1 hypothetical protein ADS46_16065 [Halomonas sp. G11]